MFPVAQVISILIKKRNLSLAADICCKFENVLIQAKWKKHLSIALLQEFCARLQDDNKNGFAEKVQQVLLNLQRGPEGADSEGESTESFRSRSSSTTSIKSYTSNSGHLQAAVGGLGSMELCSNVSENDPSTTQTNLAVSAQNIPLEENDGNSVTQERNNVDIIDGETKIISLENSKVSIETTTPSGGNSYSNSRNITEEEEIVHKDVTVDEILDNDVNEMNGDSRKLDEDDISCTTGVNNVQEEGKEFDEKEGNVCQTDEGRLKLFKINSS